MQRPRRLPVTLTDQEAEALVGAVNTKCPTGLRNRALLAVMLGAGLRVSEACGLRPADVDLQRGMVRVNRGKGAKDRVVPIDSETAGWLRAWAEKRAALGFNGRQAFFCGLRTRGDALKPRYVQDLVSRLAERAGIQKRVSPHTLRHTYATTMLRRGMNLREVQQLLGHSHVMTTEIYTHVDPEDLREKIQANRPAAPQAVALDNVLRQLSKENLQALLAILRDYAGLSLALPQPAS